MPPGGPLFLAIGTTLAAALPLLLLGALRSGWRSLAGRRRIGVLWDVGTFWPRAFHPLAPPSYAERAVPELQRRLWWLHDNGGRVLLAAHSQGSVLAAAALLQRDARPVADQVRAGDLRLAAGQALPLGLPGVRQRRRAGDPGRARRGRPAGGAPSGPTCTTRPTTSAARSSGPTARGRRPWT